MIKSDFPTMLQRKAAHYQERGALYYRDYDISQWLPMSFNQISAECVAMARALVDLGLKELDNVAIFSQNMPQIIISDFALFQNRAVAVPMYATSTFSQVEYIVKDAEIEFIFVGEQKQYDVAYQVLRAENSLKQIIVFDGKVKLAEGDVSTLYWNDLLKRDCSVHEAVVAARTERVEFDDLVNILYTSGTTGEPKGVEITYRMYHKIIETHKIRINMINDTHTTMAFLPLTHIFEKAWSYFMIEMGIANYINLYPQDIQMTIKEVRPNLMCSVPRFWEKVYEGVQDKIASSEVVMQKMMLSAIDIGFEYNVNYKRLGRKPPMVLALKYKFFEKTVFAKLKKVIGIDNGVLYPCAGAALADKINVFLQSVGVPLCYGYGLTESCATVSCFEMVGYEFGTIGKLMPDVEAKIDDNGEILLKGDTITKRYYKKPTANSESFTEDGWFKTGDKGELDQFGVLKITDRIKDLFKTANGKYIAPQALELALLTDPLFEQVVTIGDKRKYVTALIVPAKEPLIKFAQKNHIISDNYAVLLKDLKLVDLLRQRVDAALKDFAGFEQVKRFTLLYEPFSMEKGELTNTLKVKRKAINEKYSRDIEVMYL